MRYLNEHDEDWEAWTDALADDYTAQREEDERAYAEEYAREHGLTTIIGEGYDNDTSE